MESFPSPFFEEAMQFVSRILERNEAHDHRVMVPKGIFLPFYGKSQDVNYVRILDVSARDFPTKQGLLMVVFHMTGYSFDQIDHKEPEMKIHPKKFVQDIQFLLQKGAQIKTTGLW